MSKRKGRGAPRKGSGKGEPKGSGKVLYFDPEDLVVVRDKSHPLYDPRVDLPLKENFIVSVLNVGILQPIKFRKNPENGDNEVVFGRQRVRAAEEANRRLKKMGGQAIRVPAIALRGDDVMAFGIGIIENEHRQADTPLGRAEKMQRLLDLGRSMAQVARVFDCSDETVKTGLRLLESSSVVKTALESGKVNVSTAARLAKLPPEVQQERVRKLEAHAEPGTGKRRRSRAVREIVSGRAEMRTRKEIEEKAGELDESIDVSGQDKRAARAVFEWVLGEPEELDLLMGASGREDEEREEGEEIG
jgi:ParB family chromosome partitioning protein